jgi:Protein kinase domain
MLTIGSTFAGYVIEAVAGRGGMGVVYRARESRPARTVALKVISPELAADTDFRARFERESEIAATIEHPNVIPVHRVGEEAGQLFLVMRHVDGIDLSAMIANAGRLQPRRAVDIIAQVCAALDAAHARGLVHRDVKPANVLVTREGHVYLTDFGIAKRSDATGGSTLTGYFLGTLDYSAPEQIESGRVDARTDVYATGCMLYHALTGQVPFQGENAAATIWAHLSAPPPSLRAIDGTLPEQLDAVVAKAMAKAPDDRYPTAGDLGQAAEAAVDSGSPTQAEHGMSSDAATTRHEPVRAAAFPLARRDLPAAEPTLPPTPRAGAAKPPAIVILAAAGILVVGGLAIAWAAGAFSTKSAKSPAVSTSGLTTPTAGPTTPRLSGGDRIVANRFASLLRRNSGARAQVVSAVGAVSNCSMNGNAGSAALETAISARQSVVNELNGLDVSALAEGGQLLSSLTIAMRDSIAADRHFQDWMRYVAATGCSGAAPQNADFAAADASSQAAASSKTQFATAWNGVALRYGLDQVQEQDL